MSDSPITGGCHCGALRYRIDGTLGFAFACFCDSCRKLSAGARLVGVSVKPEHYTLEGPASRYTYPGGKDQIELVFCGHCSTQVAAHPAAFPNMVSLRVGSLDEPEAVQKVKPVFTDGACHWEPSLQR